MSVVGVVWWCGNLEPVPGFARVVGVFVCLFQMFRIAVFRRGVKRTGVWTAGWLLEAFPNQRGESCLYAESQAFVETDGAPVRTSYGEADVVAALCKQVEQRQAEQFVADAFAAHTGQNADLRDVTRGFRHQAGQAHTADLT